MAEKAHISLGELQRIVAGALEAALPLPVWVSAEIAELKVNGSGHCYLELVEKGSAGQAGSAGRTGSGFGIDNPDGAVPKAQARAVAWRGTWTSLSAYFRGITGSELAAGMKVLVKVVVSYHELYGFSLVVTDIDPSYTLGDRERQRQETIARLAGEGVIDMNRSLDIPFAVQRVAVVSSASAAGLRDFMQELGRFPFRFDVELFEAVMQGSGTEPSVVAALEEIASRAEDFDVVAIIRGGGSQTDLAAFDGYRLCAHIAQFPLPVVTGIGHDKDRSVADMVAALELKTPTAVAVWLGEGLAAADRLLDGLGERIAGEARSVLEHASARLERASRVVAVGASEMTRRLEVRLEHLGVEIALRTDGYFLRREQMLDGFSSAVRERPEVFLERASERLAAAERVVALRRPENILALGFAIVRTVDGDGSGDGAVGRAVFDPATLTDGQTLDITLHKGKVSVKTI